MDLARSALIRPTDLGAGWSRVPSKSEADAAPDCAWQDYSAFTITGQAQAQFTTRQGGSLIARVEVFPSRKQVLGDFAVDTRAGTAACEARALRKQFAKGPTTRVTIVSARQQAGPKVGSRSVAFHIVLARHRGSSTLPLHVDLLAFVRDRAAASIVVFTPGKATTGLTTLARLIDSRLQRVA